MAYRRRRSFRSRRVRNRTRVRNKRYDRKMFSRTAMHVKKRNAVVSVMRGGYRI